MARRARRSLPARGRCPGCGKRGLGVVRRSVVHGSVVAYRSCRYCGEHVDAGTPRDGGAGPEGAKTDPA